MPVVEGHGEQSAARDLLTRTWTEIAGGEYAHVLQPMRISRGALLNRANELEKAIQLAALQLIDASRGDASLILILIDAEDDCRAGDPLGPRLLIRAKQARADFDIACVIANVMYETWFVAAAKSLEHYLRLDGVDVPVDPETSRCGKSWIKRYMKNGVYKETVDQARLTAKMDLALCRSHSRSFDKLCRDLVARAQRISAQSVGT
jgi:hypothetical protein